MTESKPQSLSDYLASSELAAFKAGKGKLWKAAYDRARKTLGVQASIGKANIVIGVLTQRDEFERPDAALVAQVRIALTDRKIAQLLRADAKVI